jgi:hypothetical protein
MITIIATAPANMYFRLRNSVDEAGIALLIEQYKVIRETPHFALCILHYNYSRVDGTDYTKMTEKELRYRFGRSFKRIHKTASRFAFPTLEDAVKNFEYRKSQQIGLLQNQLNEITLLRKSSAAIDDNALKTGYCIFDGTEDHVHENYHFN